MRNVLSVASECVPLLKTGGLADVAGALPKALAAHGWRMRTLMPAYRGLVDKMKKAKKVFDTKDLFGGPGKLLAGQVAGLDMLLLDAPHLFDRPGNIYLGPDGKDWPDNDLRFGALSFAGAQVAQ